MKVETEFQANQLQVQANRKTKMCLNKVNC